MTSGSDMTLLIHRSRKKKNPQSPIIYAAVLCERAKAGAGSLDTSVAEKFWSPEVLVCAD